MLPVVIPHGAEELVARLPDEGVSSGRLARELQRNLVLVPDTARARMITCGKAAFAAPEVRGDQFCVLGSGPIKGIPLWLAA